MENELVCTRLQKVDTYLQKVDTKVDMARGKLTAEEQEILRQNENVEKVFESQIFYTEKFKKYFINEYKKGKTPTEIFSNAGFDISILGGKRIERAASRWKEAAGIEIPLESRRGTRQAQERRIEKLKLQLANQKETSRVRLERKDQKIAELEDEIKRLTKLNASLLQQG